MKTAKIYFERKYSEGNNEAYQDIFTLKKGENPGGEKRIIARKVFPSEAPKHNYDVVMRELILSAISGGAHDLRLSVSTGSRSLSNKLHHKFKKKIVELF